jgi:hypothetical protein
VWTKASLQAEDFLLEISGEAVDLDIECVGGGGAGGFKSSPGGCGGAGGGVEWLRGVSLSDLPDSVALTVGAGGASNGADGGNTAFGDLLMAYGGVGGAALDNAASAEYARWLKHQQRAPGSGFCRAISDAEDPSYKNGRSGPGAGGTSYAGDGGASNVSQPRNRLAQADPNSNGQSATTPWQYGSGGSRYGSFKSSGGWPGGGGVGTGGATGVALGGNGAVRIHCYAWEQIA